MRAGKFRKRFVIQQLREARDDLGGITQGWEDIRTVWGDMIPLRGAEKERAMQIEARLTHRICLRALPACNTAWRLRLDQTTRTFNPYAVTDIHERHRETEILAIEQPEVITGGSL